MVLLDPPALPNFSTAPPPAMPLVTPPPSTADDGDDSAAVVSFIVALIALTLVCVRAAYVIVVRPHQRHVMRATELDTPEQSCTRAEPSSLVNTEALTRAKQANEQQKTNGDQPQKANGDQLQKVDGEKQQQQQKSNVGQQQRGEHARTASHSVSFARKVKPAVSFARCGRVELSSCSDRRRR
eukprot:7021003-Prymnesium_polylepis.1